MFTLCCSFSQISGMIMKSNISLPDYNHKYSTIPFLVLSTIGAGREGWQAGKVCIFCSFVLLRARQSQMFQKVW